MATKGAKQPKRAAESPPEGKEAGVATVPPFEADTRIERGLMAVAAHNGNTRRASAFLAEDGLEISHQTLWNWTNKVHPDRY